MHSANSLLYPSKMDLIFKSFWEYIPERLLHLVEHLPLREYIHFRRTLHIINGVARDLIREKRAALQDEKYDEENADMMTIMREFFASHLMAC